MDLLAHGDAKRFRQAAVYLAFDDHWVDARAAIIERVEAADFCHAGVDVHVDDTDVRAEWKGEVRRIVVVHRLQARLHAGWHFVIGGPRELGHGLKALGITFHAETVDVPFEIVVVHFKHVGGDHLRLGFDLAAGHCSCRARNWRRARTIGPESIRRRVSIAFLDYDV